MRTLIRHLQSTLTNSPVPSTERNHVLIRANIPGKNEVHTSFTFLIHPGILGGDWNEVRFIYIVVHIEVEYNLTLIFY